MPEVPALRVEGVDRYDANGRTTGKANLYFAKVIDTLHLGIDTDGGKVMNIRLAPEQAEMLAAFIRDGFPTEVEGI